MTNPLSKDNRAVASKLREEIRPPDRAAAVLTLITLAKMAEPQDRLLHDAFGGYGYQDCDLTEIADFLLEEQ